MELRGDFPDSGFTYRNPTLQLDGGWHEYEWPFTDYKGEREVRFEILIEDGEGEFLLKDIEFLPI